MVNITLNVAPNCDAMLNSAIPVTFIETCFDYTEKGFGDEIRLLCVWVILNEFLLGVKMKNFRMRVQSSVVDHKSTLLGLLLLFVVGFLMSACEGDAGDGAREPEVGESTVPDACALLSDADVETILGSSAMASGSVSEDGLFSTCSWLATESGERLMLNIWAAGRAGDGWASQFLAAQAAAGEKESIVNLGDEAFAITDGDLINYYWSKHDTFVVVLTNTAGEVTEDALIDLAHKIDDGF